MIETSDDSEKAESVALVIRCDTENVRIEQLRVPVRLPARAGRKHDAHELPSRLGTPPPVE